MVRQGPQQHRVNNGEDGRVGADAQRNRQDGGEREGRVVPQRADGVAQVGSEVGHGASPRVR
jgi:hypothetical protein